MTDPTAVDNSQGYVNKAKDRFQRTKKKLASFNELLSSYTVPFD